MQYLFIRVPVGGLKINTIFGAESLFEEKENKLGSLEARNSVEKLTLANNIKT